MFDKNIIRKRVLIRPIFILIIFISFFISGALLTSGLFLPIELGLIANRILTMVLMIYSYGWMVISTSFVLSNSEVPELTKFRKFVTHYYLLLLSLIIFQSAFWFDFLKTGNNLTFLDFLPSLALMFSVIYLCIYIIWTAAKTLVYAEEGKKVPSSRIVGTALQFMYLPICIFWLHKRLKNRDKQEPI